MQNQQSSVETANQVTIGAGGLGNGTFPGHQLGNSEPPYQGERPDMDSEDGEGAEGGLPQQERADDPGDELNARE